LAPLDLVPTFEEVPTTSAADLYFVDECGVGRVGQLQGGAPGIQQQHPAPE
jgi:hypothetical protein